MRLYRGTVIGIGCVVLLGMSPSTSSGGSEDRMPGKEEKVTKGDAKVALRSARLYVRQKLYKRAIEMLEIAIKGDPKNPASHFMIGEIYAGMDKIDLMNYHFDQVVRLNPKKYGEKVNHQKKQVFVQHYNMGLRAIEKKRTDLGIEELLIATKIDSTNVDVHRTMGFAYSQSGEEEKGIASFEKAVALDPGDIQTIVNLGISYQKLGKSKEALASFQEAEKIDPTNINIVTNLVVAYQNLSRTTTDSLKAIAYKDSVMAVCDRAISIDPDNPQLAVTAGQLHLTRALSLQGAEKKDEAQEYFTSATRLLEIAVKNDPNDESSAFNLAHCYNELGKPKKAISMWQKAAEIDPTDVDTWMQLAFAQLRQEDTDEALKSFLKIIEVDPKNVRAHQFLSRLYAQRDDVAKAKEFYNKAEALKSGGTD